MDLAGIRAYAFGFYLRRAQLTYELYLPVTPEMAAEALPVLVDLNRSWTEFIASCDLDGRSRQRIERLWDRVDNLAEVRDYGNNGYYPSEPDEIPRVLDSASQLIQKTIERSADNIQFGYLAGLAVGYVDLNEEGQLSLDDEDEDAIGAFMVAMNVKRELLLPAPTAGETSSDSSSESSLPTGAPQEASAASPQESNDLEADSVRTQPPTTQNTDELTKSIWSEQSDSIWRQLYSRKYAWEVVERGIRELYSDNSSTSAQRPNSQTEQQSDGGPQDQQQPDGDHGSGEIDSPRDYNQLGLAFDATERTLYREGYPRPVKFEQPLEAALMKRLVDADLAHIATYEKLFTAWDYTHNLEKTHKNLRSMVSKMRIPLKSVLEVQIKNAHKKGYYLEVDPPAQTDADPTARCTTEE